MVFKCELLDTTLTILKVYGNYDMNHNYWDRLFNESVIRDNNLIIGGDMNFTVRRSEIWGGMARPKIFHDYFIYHIRSAELINVERKKINPTWPNKKT
jgi:hypothetical protein